MEEKLSMVGSDEVHACQDGSCTECRTRAEQDKTNDEISFAFLLSLVPVISLTLFGNMGLL